MKQKRWQITLGISLILLSIVVYFIHFLIFRDPHHILIYLVGDIAFVFFEVLLVTLVIHNLLDLREKRDRLEKLNMLIGAFYSEVGTTLLIYLSDFDPNLETIRKNLIITSDWKDEDFYIVSNKLKNYEYSIDIMKLNLGHLQRLLREKRGFLLRLLENPNLLEHETFTELLRAVFHLTEELDHRKNVKNLSEKDLSHLSGDIKRVYVQLVSEWLDYMQYLNQNYPYLFSLGLRLNPFDETASVEIK
jgi:hypothetical protein